MNTFRNLLLSEVQINSLKMARNAEDFSFKFVISIFSGIGISFDEIVAFTKYKGCLIS